MWGCMSAAGVGGGSHKLKKVLLYSEGADAAITSCLWSSDNSPTRRWSKTNFWSYCCISEEDHSEDDWMAKYLSWSEHNRTPGEFWRASWASLSIQYPGSKSGHAWRMEKEMLQYVNLFNPCLEDLVMSFKTTVFIQNTRCSSFGCRVYSFLI